MKTTKNTNRLAFAKNAIVELNDSQLLNVNGGSMDAIINYIGDKIKDMMKPQV
ncbi:class I lanthipeptide [Flavobacterium cerinum]|uniref:Class I lanthipeptide n=1 Tax=Flavobacterium cerinum TaxID=2502784 RepID=A0ABY5IV05_9FLAO|nr:class I lanthipeptide [Flavobacterium cerinum]UUC46211.1 class I lanthipeptide [Flavobacterium cerinum]